MSRTLVALMAAVAILVALPAAANADVSLTVKGRWTCSNRGTVTPIAGARVEFWEDISFWPDDKVGATHTAADGSFRFDVRANDNFDLYVKLMLNDDDGVKLGDWYSFSDWGTETSSTRSHSGTVDLGTWQIDRDGGRGTPKCAIWQGAHNAYANFRGLTGLRPPDSTYSISADFPCCGVPFTTTDTTRWPVGYQTGYPGDPDGGYSVNFHEFAHSVRHSYDGGTAHFLFDAARFSYLQNHNLCSNTNPGFAFNEGWAEYWAKTLTTCAGDPTNYSYEGNVATALTGLEKCAGRATMARILRQSPGSIHSYQDFLAKYNATVSQRFCTIGGVTGTVNVEPSLTAQQQTSSIQGQITALQGLIGRLSRQSAGARRQARTVGGCAAARRCGPAVEKLIAPSALATQIAQAKLVLGRLRAGLAAAKAQPDLAALDALAANRGAFDRANQRLVLAGLKAGVKAVRSDGPAKATANGDFRRLQSRVSLLTRASRRGTATPPQVATLFAAPSPPTDIAAKVRGRVRRG
jgi:hypothetical protein